MGGNKGVGCDGCAQEGGAMGGTGLPCGGGGTGPVGRAGGTGLPCGGGGTPG